MTTITEHDARQTVLRLLTEIAPEADLDALPPDAELREALDIDSFDMLNLMIGLDDALGIEIPEADYGRMTTLNDIVAYVSAHQP